MCEIDWKLLLEYIKVVLSWPVVTVVLVIVFFRMFRVQVGSFLNRLEEASVLGQKFKSTAQQPSHPTPLDAPTIPTPRAVETTVTNPAGASATDLEEIRRKLPPDLAQDPKAPAAIAFIHTNPVETLREYKALWFNYLSERLFQDIFGTQIELLVDLEARGGKSVPLAHLAQYHTKHLSLAKSNRGIDAYINYLVDSNIVEMVGEANAHEYKITELGTRFLAYLRAHRPKDWTMRPY